MSLRPCLGHVYLRLPYSLSIVPRLPFSPYASLTELMAVGTLRRQFCMESKLLVAYLNCLREIFVYYQPPESLKDCKQLLSFSKQFAFLSHLLPHTPVYPLCLLFDRQLESTMCRWRRVRNIYNCGHYVDLEDELVQCVDSRCKFSDMHPAQCPNCRSTCWQYRQFPETYFPQLDRPCADCRRRGAGSTSRR